MLFRLIELVGDTAYSETILNYRFVDDDGFGMWDRLQLGERPGKIIVGWHDLPRELFSNIFEI